MMTKCSSQSAAASAIPSTHLVAMATDPVVSVRTLSDLIAVFELYKKYLADRVLDNPIRHVGDKKTLDCEYNRLSDLEAFIILSLVWKESHYLSDEDLLCAGLPRRFPKGVTRAALGKALRESDRRPYDSDTEDMFARRAGRIVEAAITFGLIESGEQRPSLKFLVATRKLHDMLLEIGSAAATIIHGPFGCTPGGSPPSTNGAGG